LTEPEPSAGPGGRLPNLGPLALARETVDRCTEHRTDPEWLEARWAEPGTRVLVVNDGQALARLGEDDAELVLLPVSQAPDGPRYLLGVDDAGLLTHAVALDNWHSVHTHCPRCGALTNLVSGGHSRICPVDHSEHFPRTDPAMITLVTDARDRALLARNSAWPQRRVSILAGFVEPGESVEHAVEREVAEETGIVVHEIRYLGSQPWPMPASLMLGFWARAHGTQPIRVDEEEIVEAYWFSRDELRAAMAAEEIRLPPPVSIAYRIIESWYGDELPAQW
jgi:NAD+ diphosphatase